ncbi:Uncharacterised protein [Mycobacterium tuberculosis]|nr:Uncharacterised protein [Mycobacterium tuberculosis]
MADLLDSTSDPKKVEEGLIAYYNDPEYLFYLMVGMYQLAAMRKRRHLVEAAKDDYFAGRYYSCIHVLLSVMDGFVNEYETVRRGLHARQEEELQAWDSIVGHHMGLTNAHKTFTKGRSKTNEEPIYELYRNGIVHGSQLNYNNVIVATKAWNRLFAVIDWAKARKREKTPAPVKSSWRELFARFNEIQTHKRALDAWKPAKLAEGYDEFERHPAYIAASGFLDVWKRCNYGDMAKAVAAEASKKHDKAMPARIREEYLPYRLSSYQIVEIDHCAPAICMVTTRLVLASGEQIASMRWIHENDKGEPIAASLPGSWRLLLWEPSSFLASSII